MAETTNGDRYVHTERPIDLIVTQTQPALSEKHTFNGRVEVYDITVPVRIPTQTQSSYLVDQIMGGHSKGALIVSPNGGLAIDEYCKRIENLRADKDQLGVYGGENGTEKIKRTGEDTERFWILNNPEFRRELVANGWMVFPEIQAMGDFDKKERGYFEHQDVYLRKFKLGDFVRVMELVSNPKEIDYSVNIADMKELMPLGNDISFTWEPGQGLYHCFFNLDVKYKGKEFSLDLKGVENSFPRRSNADPQPLLRSVDLTVRALPWSRDITEMFIGEYCKAKNIIFDYATMRNEPLRISLRNRRHGNNTPAITTPALLDQAIELEAFLKEARGRQSEKEKRKSTTILAYLRKEAGLPVPASSS